MYLNSVVHELIIKVGVKDTTFHAKAKNLSFEAKDLKMCPRGQGLENVSSGARPLLINYYYYQLRNLQV